MGMNGFSNLLCYSTLHTFSSATTKLKYRCAEVRLINEARPCPMVVVDANLMSCKPPSRKNPAKYAHAVAEIFSE